MEHSDSDIKAAQKVLGEPVHGGLDSKAQRIRNTLFVIASIAIGYELADLKIAPDSSILGLRFDGLDDWTITMALLIFVSYLTIHYLWSAVDSVLEWRLRITGTKVAFITGAKWGDANRDYPDDPRQSTLYNWWLDQCATLEVTGQKFDKVSTELSALSAEADRLRGQGPEMNFNNVLTGLSGVRNELSSLGTKIEASSKVIQSTRIPASLERFDSWFRLFLVSQNSRWFIFDLLLPVGLGLVAVSLLARQLL